MSEEKPRLSRRQMREQGMLGPVTDGPSPIEELSRTQEISLNRLSRKEMRERERASKAAVDSEVEAAKQEAARRATTQREAEAAARRAVSERASAEAAARAAANRERIAQAQRAAQAEQDAARHDREQAERAAAAASDDLAAAEATLAESAESSNGAGRRSVFERFDADAAGTSGSAGSGWSAASAPSARSANASWASSTDDDEDRRDGGASLQDRLLDRMRSEGYSTGPSAGSASPEVGSETAPVESHHTLGEAVAGESWTQVSSAGDAGEPEEAAAAGAKEESDAEASSDTGVPKAKTSAREWAEADDVEAEYEIEELQEDKPRNILMTVIGILIGLVLGIALGFAVRHFFLESGGYIDPYTIVSSVPYLNGFLY
ncbi:MAG: hypothetical protein ACTHW1_10950 [Ancrocorticia sp.]|uniref:hypothetical protein n=1 Tax=Ancrocorticia sp. TaxID=2593684 RepID=UPI003F92FBEB